MEHSARGESGPARGGVWRICVDTGGTFTDCIAIDPQGQRHRAKALSAGAIRVRLATVESDGAIALEGAPEGLDLVGWRLTPAGSGADGVEITHWDDEFPVGRCSPGAPVDWTAGMLLDLTTGEPAPLIVTRVATGTGLRQSLPPIMMRLATTRGTNALLEGNVARVALFVTEGFGDLLEIGDQRRPDLFALDIRKRALWHERSVEVPGRISAQGEELRALDEAAVRRSAREMMGAGITSAAVSLANAWIYPAHEIRVEEILREAGFAHVSRSTAVAPMMGLLARARTAVVNAALSGAVSEFVASIRNALPHGSTIEVMTSAAGMLPDGKFQPKDSLLSGPAAGVAGAMAVGRASGAEQIIAFDMGGTSTDVSRCDTRVGYEYVFRHEVAGAEILAPAIAIESVAAGGGSICDVVDGAPRVGPRSAGANPGPACYGAGGPLTITDVNLLLGRIDASRFATPIDVGAAEEAFEAVCARAGISPGETARRDGVLQGFLDLANERMAGAIRRVSARRGYDPAEYALVSFGGAGGQHACAVAERLGITQIICPAEASLLSAAGLDVASAERVLERQLLAPLEEIEADLERHFGALEAQGRDAVARQRAEALNLRVRRIVRLRLSGQEFAHAIDWTPEIDLREVFRARCEEVFGHAPTDRSVEVESLRVIVSAEQAPAEAQRSGLTIRRASPSGTMRARFADQWQSVSVFERASMQPGDMVEGPALVREDQTIIVVEPGWEATLDDSGSLVLWYRELRREARPAKPAMVKIELGASRLIAIAEEMGETLRRTAISTNVKERLDYSCAILDPHGRLIVSAPHVPVHLGALGVCVRRLVRARGDLPAGSAIVTNHPAFGGSHLPDVTVVAPAHDDSGRLLGYVACRAHHAEIGGTRPGSMPPGARTLEEEGAVILPMPIMEQRRARWELVRAALTGGKYPTRAPADNLSDLEAQLAACRGACEALRLSADEMGPEVMLAGMNALLKRAEIGARAGLDRLGDGYRGEAIEPLEDAAGSGSALRVAVEVKSGRLRIDFTGTSGVHPGNLNAPAAVTQSAVIYVVRLLIGATDADLPLNEGLLGPVEIIAPPGLLNPTFTDDPATSPAVAAGNVETSQKLVNTLTRALGICADSQGTMNNTLFGGEAFGFYETICGGTGAGPTFEGASAVHSHMTNTAITDVEVMERRYPVRVERFAVRRGSGGAGQHRGGDGTVREFTFLAPVSLSVLTQNRTRGPLGGAGGADGSPGRQRVIRADGSVETLEAIDARELNAGDRLIMETPGGGGWGAA